MASGEMTDAEFLGFNEAWMHRDSALAPRVHRSASELLMLSPVRMQIANADLPVTELVRGVMARSATTTGSTAEADKDVTRERLSPPQTASLFAEHRSAALAG